MDIETLEDKIEIDLALKRQNYWRKNNEVIKKILYRYYIFMCQVINLYFFRSNVVCMTVKWE